MVSTVLVAAVAAGVSVWVMLCLIDTPTYTHIVRHSSFPVAQGFVTKQKLYLPKSTNLSVEYLVNAVGMWQVSTPRKRKVQHLHDMYEVAHPWRSAFGTLHAL